MKPRSEKIMNRTFQSCLLFALGVHGILLFGITISQRNISTAKSHPLYEVNLVEAPPEVAEAPAPIPEPPAAVTETPASIEPPKEILPTQREPEPVKALLVTEPAAVLKETEFQIAATTNPVVSAPSQPLTSPPAKEISAPQMKKAQARYRENPEPRYPLEARRRREEGRVLLNVLLDAAGAPEKVAVKESSGSELLDSAAISAVARWKFDPASDNGKPVDSEVEVPVRFQLSKGTKD
jgi:protein TonB